MAKESVIKEVVTTTRTTGGARGAGRGAPAAEPEPADETPDYDSEIEGAIEEIGANGSRCRITRLDERMQKFVMLATVDASRVSHEFVQTEFGGGTYTLRFRSAGRHWGRQVTLTIDARIPAKIPKWLLGEPEAPAGTIAAAKPRAGDEEDEDDEKMFKRMYRMRFLDLIEQGDKLRARQDEQALRSSEMTMNMMKTMMESISASAASMRAVPANAQPQLSFADLLKMQADTRRETMELIKDLRGGNAEANSIDKALAMMNKLREQSSSFISDDDGDGSGGGFAGLLLELGKALAPALANLLGPKGAPAADTAPAATTATVRPILTPPPAAPADSPAAPESAVPQPPMWVTFAKASLLDAAQEARDPRSYAISILETVPRPMHGQIREAVMREDAVQQILETIPELVQYTVWVTQCVDAFRNEFDPPPVE